jgi:hypothetical protein
VAVSVHYARLDPASRGTDPVARCFRLAPHRSETDRVFRSRNVDAFRAQDFRVWNIKPGLQ